MASKAGVAFVFVLMMIVIIFLVWQIFVQNNQNKDFRVDQQAKVTQAARLVIQSATQNHPQLAYEHAFEAKLLIDNIIDSNGGVLTTEKVLKLENGSMERLREQIYTQYSTVASFVLEHIVAQRPSLDFEANEMAGFKKPEKNRKKSGRKRDKHY